MIDQKKKMGKSSIRMSENGVPKKKKKNLSESCEKIRMAKED